MREKKPIEDLDQYNNDYSDLEIQYRGMTKCDDAQVALTLYAWLSEKRKAENRSELAKVVGKYCPFIEGEKVSKTYHGLKLTGKIEYIVRDYYDGDCLVLNVKLDKRSSKKLLEKVNNL